MSKSDQNKVIKQSNQQIDAIKQQGQANQAILGDMFNRATAASSELYPGIVSNYSSIADTGGFDPTILGTINRAYTGLAEGGFTPAQEGAIKNEATRAATSGYAAARTGLSRSAASTGSDPSAALARMARESGQAASRAVTGVDASLAAQKAANVATGAAGLGGTQQALTGNRLAATGGMTGIYGMNLQQATDAVRGILQNYQISGTLTNQDLQILQQIANRPGLFDNIIRGIGAVSAGFGAAFPGGLPTKSSGGGGGGNPLPSGT